MDRWQVGRSVAGKDGGHFDAERTPALPARPDQKMIRSPALALFAKQQVAEVSRVLAVHLIERFDEFCVTDTIADLLAA